MTLPAQTAHVEYFGDDSVGPFTYDWRIDSAGEMEVRVNSTVKTRDVHYTLSGIGNENGGNVTFITGQEPTTGAIVALRRIVDFDQLLDLVPNSALPAESVEARLDQLTKMMALINEEMGRTPTLRPGVKSAFRGLELPHPDSLSLLGNGKKVLSWNDAENTLILREFGNADELVGLISSTLETATFGGLPAAGDIATLRYVTDSVRGVWVDQGDHFYHLTGEWVDAKGFGCKGDGTTDDTLAIRSAISDCPQFGTVIFPPGVYLTSGWDISGRDDITFLGLGNPKIRHYEDGPNELNPGNEVIILADTCNNITIRGLTFDLNGQTDFGGILFYDSTNIRIEHNVFLFSDAPTPAHDYYAIIFGLGVGLSSNIYIRNNLVNGSVIEVNKAERVWIENNVSVNSLTNGIVWASLAEGNVCRDYHIHNNIVVNARGAAISVSYDAEPVNQTVERLSIRNNLVYYDNTSNDNRNAINVGDSQLILTDTGSIWNDIHICDNYIIWTTTASAVNSPDLIHVGLSQNGTGTMKRVSVKGNYIDGGYSDDSSRLDSAGILTQFIDQLNISNNHIRNFTTGIKYVAAGDASGSNGAVSIISMNIIQEIGESGLFLQGAVSAHESLICMGNIIQNTGLDMSATYPAIVLDRLISHSIFMGNYINASDASAGIVEDSGNIGNIYIGNRILNPSSKVVKDSPNVNTTAVGTGAATSGTDLQTVAVHAQTMGINGAVRVHAHGSVTDSAGANKSVKLFWGTTELAELAYVGAAEGEWSFDAIIQNDAAENAQQITVRGYNGTTLEVMDVLTSTQNTASAVIVKTQGTTADNNDEITSEVLRVDPL